MIKKNQLKNVTLMNIIGLSILSISLIFSFLFYPFAWSELFIGINLFTSIPLIVIEFIMLRNNNNVSMIQNVLIAILVIFGIPSLAFSSFYGLELLLIISMILNLGIWKVIIIKEIERKILIITALVTCGLFMNFILLLIMISRY